MKFSKIWYVDASQQIQIHHEAKFSILAFFGLSGPFSTFLVKNEENCQNPNSLMKFSGIWYVDASQQKKCYKKTFFGFWSFFAFFQQKTAKIDKK